MMRWIASLVVGAVLLLAVPAAAQPTKDPANRDAALALYERGNVKYNLGEWKEAIRLFTEAYETYAAPEFLFNIAQAYRQDENCDRALFFYRRYLDNKPDAANRGEVEAFMAELEAKTDCKNTEPRDQPEDTGDDTPDLPVDTPVAEPEPDVSTTEIYQEPFRPSLLSARVGLGPSFASIGPLDTPVLLAIAGTVGYPLSLGTFDLEPGVVLSYTPVPWERGMPVVKGTAGLTGILANLSGRVPVAGQLAVRADIGAGMQIMSGLQEENNPFVNADQTQGTVTMFHARVGAGLELSITDNLLVSVEPVLSFSPAGALRDDIDSITRFDVLVGGGYRL